MDLSHFPPHEYNFLINHTTQYSRFDLPLQRQLIASYTSRLLELQFVHKSVDDFALQDIP